MLLVFVLILVALISLTKRAANGGRRPHLSETDLAIYIRTHRPDLWEKIGHLTKAQSLEILNEATGLDIKGHDLFLPSSQAFLKALQEQDKRKQD